MLTTLREQLDLLGFDWDSGVILIQEVKKSTEYNPSPGWASEDELEPGRIITAENPILDAEFDSGFGAPECPRFVAHDKKFYYFPYQYDGATGVDKIARDFHYYRNHPTPYSGGG